MAPWISVLILAAYLLATAIGILVWHEFGSRGRALKYRELYEQLIFDLERLVQKANSIHHAATTVKDAVLLDHYHSSIKMIEVLLTAVKKIEVYGEDKESLSAPIFLSKDIHARLQKIEKAMHKAIIGKPHEFMKSDPGNLHGVLGCHFCSRPFEAQLFSKVRVKIDEKSSEVASCNHCRERLLRTRKARVLFFNEDGVQVHWSKAKAWTPLPEYWTINRDETSGLKKTPHLELVYSNVSRINSQSQNKD